MGDAATQKSISQERASDGRLTQSLLPHPKTCLIFLITWKQHWLAFFFFLKKRQTQKNVSSKKQVNSSEPFSCCDLITTEFETEAALKWWRKFGHQVTLADTLCYSQTCWASLPSSLSLLTCLWSERTFELCFLGTENKHVRECRELLLALMSLYQHDRIWFLHIS